MNNSINYLKLVFTEEIVNKLIEDESYSTTLKRQIQNTKIDENLRENLRILGFNQDVIDFIFLVHLRYNLDYEGHFSDAIYTRAMSLYNRNNFRCPG